MKERLLTTCLRLQKFELQECDYHDVLFAVKSDVEFLKGCGLMDYSLIVGCLTERLIPGTALLSLDPQCLDPSPVKCCNSSRLSVVLLVCLS